MTTTNLSAIERARAYLDGSISWKEATEGLSEEGIGQLHLAMLLARWQDRAGYRPVLELRGEDIPERQ